MTRDSVLEQLHVCITEEQVFDVVGKNKAKLAVNHVSQAVGMLWQFQKEKPQILRTPELISSHPQFLTLRVLAENKISHMDNLMLVDILYNFLRYVKSYVQNCSAFFKIALIAIMVFFFRLQAEGGTT